MGEVIGKIIGIMMIIIVVIIIIIIMMMMIGGFLVYVQIHSGGTSRSGAAKSGSHICASGARGPGPMVSGEAL